MAGKLISQATQTTPASSDIIPLARPGDTTARYTTIGSMLDLWSSYYINVIDYGADTTGASYSDAAFEDALDVATTGATGIQKGTVVIVPPGRYKFANPINLCDRSDIKILGYGGMTYNTELSFECAGKACVEMIGAQDITIEGIAIKGDATLVPAIGIWTARSNVNVSASRIYFRDIYIYGSFSLACWLNCGSESNHWDHCYTYPSNAGCAAGILFDYRNALSGITPDNATLNLTYDTAICRIFNSYLTAAATATSYIPVYVYAGNAPKIRDSYLVSWGAPIFYLRGGASELVIDEVAIEGTPTYTLHITKDATYNVPGYVSRFSMHRTPGYGTSQAIYCDDDTVIRDSFVYDCAITDDVRFYNIENCKFDHWARYTTADQPTMTVAGYAIDAYIHINLGDSLTIVGATNNVIVDDESGTPPRPYSFVNRSLIVDSSYGSAVAANVQKILTASTTWDPANLADGASTTTYLAVSGVLADGTWIAWASLSTMIAQGWMITAHPYSGGVVVTIMNRTGGAVDLGSGTLRVVAMKVA